LQFKRNAQTRTIYLGPNRSFVIRTSLFEVVLDFFRAISGLVAVEAVEAVEAEAEAEESASSFGVCGVPALRSSKETFCGPKTTTR
jgi:hypothetical protein